MSAIWGDEYLTLTRMGEVVESGLAGFDDAARALATRRIETALDLYDLEKEASRLGSALADAIVGHAILATQVDATTRKAAARATREAFRAEGEQARIQNVGPRPVSVRLAGGAVLKLQTPYLRPSRKGLPGRPRTKRGEGGSGRYPILDLLGIRDGVTPLVRSHVGKMVVICSSYVEAQTQLATQGLQLDVSTMVRVAVATGADGLRLRDEALQAALDGPLPEESLVAGRRIRVSLDGGRARTRQTHDKHRKQKNGRRAFDLLWREPRLITVDVLDDNGDVDKNIRPIYEVELSDADTVFKTLAGLLRFIGADQAAEVCFVADGADWIWARVDALVERAEIPPERVHKILDFYHASEHINDALKACKHLSSEERKTLHAGLSRLLVQPDGHAMVLARLTEFARGRRAAAVNKEIRYFRKHCEHMQYHAWREARVPIGSGVVESAIRRVVNQRFKGASICWREDHLLPLMYLRCVLKAGRWDEFMLAQIERRHWVGGPAIQALEDESQAA